MPRSRLFYASADFSKKDAADIHARFDSGVVPRAAVASPASAGTPLEELFNQLPAGIIVVSASSRRVALANRCAEEMLGLALGDLDHPVAYDDLPAYARDGAKLPSEQRPLSRALAGEGPLRDELLILRPDGRLVRVWATSIPIRGSEGRVAWAVMVLEPKNQASLKTADVIPASVGSDLVFGMAAHDLRTPLASIVAGAELLLRHGDVSSDQARVLGRIVRSSARMSRILDLSLDVVRARLTGCVVLKRRAGTLRDVVEAVIAELRAAHPHRSIVPDLEGLGAGSWDLDRASQVVSNLLENAVRHGDPQTPVHVSLRDRGGLAELSVHNAGPPIDRHLLPVIFDPFTRAERAAADVRLGLFICREIVQAHNGTITVDSTSELGTTFVVRLPVVSVETAEG